MAGVQDIFCELTVTGMLLLLLELVRRTGARFNQSSAMPLILLLYSIAKYAYSYSYTTRRTDILLVYDQHDDDEAIETTIPRQGMR
jgi:hypothetical protein